VFPSPFAVGHWVFLELGGTTTMAGLVPYFLTLVRATKRKALAFSHVKHNQFFSLPIYFPECSICF
jgi:hypothetical protein